MTTDQNADSLLLTQWRGTKRAMAAIFGRYDFATPYSAWSAADRAAWSALSEQLRVVELQMVNEAP